MASPESPAEMGATLRRVASEIELSFPPGTERAAGWAIYLRRVSYRLETMREDPRLDAPVSEASR